MLILTNTGCGIIKPSWLKEENSTVVERPDNEVIEGIDGPTGGHFNPDGEWIPDKPEIPMTYKIPDIASSIIVDINSFKEIVVSPALHIEIAEINTHIPYLGVVKLDAGVAYMRGFVYIGKLWTNIFEISTGVFGGYNFEDKTPSFGVAATIIRF